MPPEGPLWSLDGVSPQVAADAWVAPTASVIGDVVLGPRVNVWFHCVLRGDTNHIRVGEGSNIQDGTIVHIATGRFPCMIGRHVTVGHACIVHACTLEDRAFVGMGATVLDGAVIAEGGMLAAGGPAHAGQAHRPERAMGRQPSPADARDVRRGARVLG